MSAAARPPEDGADPILAWLADLQARIVAGLEALDGGRFQHDAWTREPGAAGDDRSAGPGSPAGAKPAGSAIGRGAGLSCVLEDGRVFERAGVLRSEVHLDRLPPSASASRPGLAGRAARAAGVSMVLHPRNPHVPTVHMNVRHFIAPATAAGEPAIAWFGGGMDLTPYYPVEDDARHFHRSCRDALAPFGADLYPRFKSWCDEYFYLRHRDEPRGIGGVFFDDLSAPDLATAFAITRAVGEAFLPAYAPIVERRAALPYGERERRFQALRRGRYVEFNLVQDRGTIFGLASGGRTESILCSMPPTASWQYQWAPEPGSPEARLVHDFLPPRDWVD